MDKAQLLTRLSAQASQTAGRFRSLDDATFFSRPQPEKWSPAEVARHLVLSVRPLILAHALPEWLLRLLFGKPNRPGRSYEQLVERYKQKLAAGGRASAPFVPKPIAHDANKESVVAEFEKAYARYAKRLMSIREADLDRYLLPHPLLGKLSLREMTYFTIYHLEHHRWKK
jgi:hypothetical protein